MKHMKHMKYRKLFTALVVVLLLALASTAAHAIYIYRFDSGGTYYSDPYGGSVVSFEYGNGAGGPSCTVCYGMECDTVYGSTCYEDYDSVKITYEVTETDFGTQSGTKTLLLENGLYISLWSMSDPYRCNVGMGHFTSTMEDNEFWMWGAGPCEYEVDITAIKWEDWDS